MWFRRAKQPMELFYNILIGFWPFWVGLAMVIAGFILLKMYAPGGKNMPYHTRDRLVTKAELRFFKTLVKSVQDDFEIFVMVRIADILRVDPDVNKEKVPSTVYLIRIRFFDLPGYPSGSSSNS